MKALALIFLSLCVLVSFYACESMPSPPQSPINAENLSLAEAMKLGASVYICTIDRIDFDTAMEGTSVNIKPGIVYLTVDEVLRGASRKNMVLPFYYFYSGSFPPVWPILDGALHAKLICVVVPNAVNFRAPLILSVHEVEAASWAELVDPNESNARAFKAVIQIYDNKSTPEVVKMLADAMAASDPHIFVSPAYPFALDLVMLKASQTAPEDALRFVQAYATHPDHLTAEYHAHDVIHWLDAHTVPWNSMQNVRQFYIRCLVMLAKTEPPDIRQDALSALSKEAHTGLHASLSVTEKEGLKKVLDAEANSSDAAVQSTVKYLRSWLDDQEAPPNDAGHDKIDVFSPHTP